MIDNLALSCWPGTFCFTLMCMLRVGPHVLLRVRLHGRSGCDGPRALSQHLSFCSQEREHYGTLTYCFLNWQDSRAPPCCHFPKLRQPKRRRWCLAFTRLIVAARQVGHSKTSRWIVHDENGADWPDGRVRWRQCGRQQSLRKKLVEANGFRTLIASSALIGKSAGVASNFMQINTPQVDFIISRP